jgi:hypothetical protein
LSHGPGYLPLRFLGNIPPGVWLHIKIVDHSHIRFVSTTAQGFHLFLRKNALSTL